MDPTAAAAQPTFDPAEVARFSRIAAEWWDPNGKFRPLHQLGPVRMAFLRREAVRHFSLDDRALRPLSGLTAIDVGCGGGLVSEPLSRLGATVTAIDPSPETIAAARHHAAGQGLAIDYRAERIEEVAAAGRTFDLVVSLEVLEHVPDPAAFVKLLASVTRPGGLVVVSTLNRTLKAWLLAIVGAEYVLRWLPAGTHQWDRFITPDELTRFATTAGLAPGRAAGLLYNPLTGSWTLGPDTDVNYLMAATRPA